MKKRYLLAALIAPIIIPTLFFIATVIFSGYLDAGEGHLIKLVQATVGAILPLSYMASIALGAPILCVLSKLKRVSILTVIPSSVIVAFSLGFIWTQIIQDPDGHHGLPIEQAFALSLLSGLAGLLVSLMYCLIARITWRNKQNATHNRRR